MIYILKGHFDFCEGIHCRRRHWKARYQLVKLLKTAQAGVESSGEGLGCSSRDSEDRIYFEDSQ